jgi:subtilisin family serine protease
LDKPSNAHGTACSGIIGATADNGIGIAGVAHGCKIIPIKVFYYIDTVYNGVPLNDIPYSTSQWFANAINWAWRNAEADVMSNSWGLDDIYLQLLSGSPMLVEEAIIAAADSGRLGLGTPMLFSSGNANTEPIWPSRLPQTISVNATSMCDERKNPNSCDGENWTGCWGYALDVSAPGVKITTCDISGNKGYTSGDYTFSFNGTSAACPNAAGVVALMLSVRPDLSLSAVRYVLGSTADRVGGYNYNQNYNAGTWSQELGYGRVNAYKAVVGAQEYTGHNQTGIVDLATNEQPLQLYPNPLQGNQVTLQFDLPASTKARVNITGLDGRMVYQRDMGLMYDGTNEYTITFDKVLAPGAYLVGLTTGNQTTYSKLVIINQQ